MAGRLLLRSGQHQERSDKVLKDVHALQLGLRGRCRTATRIGLFAMVSVAWVALGCQPDESPLKGEIETLQKQLAKQDSVILSLQEGNKVMQQQIDLLNGELREAEQKTENVEVERKKLRTKIDNVARQNRKLSAQVKRVLAKNAQAANAIRVADKGAATREVLHSLKTTSKATEAALSRNGYTLRVTVRTDKRAVYVTDRKVSAPASLEVPGFRNQYVVSLQALPSKGTLVSVKADFERTGQAGRILAVGPAETAEIEKRLIAEIVKSLANSQKKQR